MGAGADAFVHGIEVIARDAEITVAAAPCLIEYWDGSDGTGFIGKEFHEGIHDFFSFTFGAAGVEGVVLDDDDVPVAFAEFFEC